MRKVEIGCGKKRRPGYECCDVRNLPGVDHVCEADNLPFPDSSIEEIYSRHLVEHLTLKEFLKTLSEWNRVLKIGGTLYIVCPNLLWHLEQILKGSHESFYNKDSGKNDRYWGYGSLFGWQQDKYDIHKFGYYFELLSDVLEEAGFTDIRNLTNLPNSLEEQPHHLEVSAKKSHLFKDYKHSKLFNHFDVLH